MHGHRNPPFLPTRQHQPMLREPYRPPSTPPTTPNSLIQNTTYDVEHLNFVSVIVANLDCKQFLDKDKLNKYTRTAVRRSLRHHDIRSNSKLYPPFSIALCALSHFTQLSLNRIYQLYISLKHIILISFTDLENVYFNAWKPIYSTLHLPALNLSLSETPKTPKSLTRPIAQKTPKTQKSSGIFASTHLIFIPSPLFSKTSAATLSARAVEKGAVSTKLLSPGGEGMNEARCVCESLKKQNETDRIIIIADAALTKRRADTVAQLDHVVPPRWLTDSLKASRFKPISFYSVTPCKPPPPSPPPPKTAPELVAGKKRKFVQEEGDDDDEEDQEIRKNDRQFESRSPADFRAEKNFVPSSGVRNRDGSKRRRTDGSWKDDDGELEAGTSFTVATRLFATPEKKSSKCEDNDDDNGNDNGNGEVITTIDMSTKCNINNNKQIIKEKENNMNRGGRWACEIRTDISYTEFPSNIKICELLSIVQASYESTKRDTFRSLGYQKAISRLKTINYEIVCMDDVRRLKEEENRNIGEGMINKIREIVKTGRLQQAESVLKDKNYTTIQILCGVWGIGPVRAVQLMNNGIKNINDLRKAVLDESITLDRCQIIGLNRYEDLLHKMPRSYVCELEMYVKKVVKSVDILVNITVAGSYLRGKSWCGDADILVYGEEKRVCKALPLIRELMKKDGVLTDDLIMGDDKYFGVFKLPGRAHGRIDLFAVPIQEYPYALLTYTGNAVFNRSMRAKARSLGYSLSHRSLQKVIRSKDGKSRCGDGIVVKCEEEIFDMLHIAYVAPCKRSI